MACAERTAEWQLMRVLFCIHSSHWPCVLLGNKKDCISSFQQIPTHVEREWQGMEEEGEGGEEGREGGEERGGGRWRREVQGGEGET